MCGNPAAFARLCVYLDVCLCANLRLCVGAALLRLWVGRGEGAASHILRFYSRRMNSHVCVWNMSVKEREIKDGTHGPRGQFGSGLEPTSLSMPTQGLSCWALTVYLCSFTLSPLFLKFSRVPEFLMQLSQHVVPPRVSCSLMDVFRRKPFSVPLFGQGCLLLGIICMDAC